MGKTEHDLTLDNSHSDYIDIYCFQTLFQCMYAYMLACNKAATQDKLKMVFTNSLKTKTRFKTSAVTLILSRFSVHSGATATNQQSVDHWSRYWWSCWAGHSGLAHPLHLYQVHTTSKESQSDAETGQDTQGRRC